MRIPSSFFVPSVEGTTLRPPPGRAKRVREDRGANVAGPAGPQGSGAGRERRAGGEDVVDEDHARRDPAAAGLNPRRRGEPLSAGPPNLAAVVEASQRARD